MSFTTQKDDLRLPHTQKKSFIFIPQLKLDKNLFLDSQHQRKFFHERPALWAFGWYGNQIIHMEMQEGLCGYRIT